VNEAIEPLRREKVLGSGLEARPRRPAGIAGGLAGTVHHRRRRARGEPCRDPHEDAQVRPLLAPPARSAEDGALCGRCEDVVAAQDEALHEPADP
jgi:isoleucyl-tRNA synthetase